MSHGRLNATQQPVDPRDFPDPFVLAAGNRFYAFATNAGFVNVQVLSSNDLLHWEPLPDALPSLARWAAPGFTWAPAVLTRGDGFVLYYTVREPHAGRQAISVAWSARAEGPYEDTSDTPLIYQLAAGGSIDPSPFVDADGSAYLAWKDDANALRQPPSLWLQPLAADGLSLTGDPIRLLTADAPWEDRLIEAPSIVLQDGTYYLFYSAGPWNSARYAIGYATAARVSGPYRKATIDGPWFAADRGVAGPGGQEFFVDGTSQVWMAYHGWQPGREGYRRGGARSLRLARVSFAGGTPAVFPEDRAGPVRWPWRRR
ncbi:MAG: family 43 glycosylhydrolase [Acidimicrobiaceae bacterium]|nr:family 43 glycosylhydrolase [Acidimicrobiaceae bacterium]